MTGLFSRSKPRVVKSAHTLGRAKGIKYLEVEGGEYVESGRVATTDEAGEGVVLLEVTEREFDDRGNSLPVSTHYRRLLPVERGTFEREREQATRQHVRPQRYVDALAVVATLAPRQPRIFGGGGSSWASPAAAHGVGSYVDGRPAIRGRDLLPFLESRGVSLRMHAGKLLPSAPAGHVPVDLRQIIEIAELLLIGYLTRKPALCELPHDGKPEEAWTVLGKASGILACFEHATGDVPQ